METPSERLSHSFITAAESHYFPTDWWSLPPNKQLPYYLCELHPLPFFLPLRADPSLRPLVPHPIPGGFFFFSSATASISHSYLLSVQLLDLVMGGKPGLNWCTAGFYVFPVCFQWGGWGIITRPYSPVSTQAGGFKSTSFASQMLKWRMRSLRAISFPISSSCTIKNFKDGSLLKKNHHYLVFYIFKVYVEPQNVCCLKYKWQSLCLYVNLPFADDLRAGEDNCLWLLCDISIWLTNCVPPQTLHGQTHICQHQAGWSPSAGVCFARKKGKNWLIYFNTRPRWLFTRAEAFDDAVANITALKLNEC